MENIRYFILLNLISVVVALFVAVISWQRRRTSGGLTLFLLMVAVAQWGLFSAVEIAAQTIPEKIFWSKIAYIGTLTSPVFFLLFALDYTGKRKWLSFQSTSLFLIIPVLTFLLALTNEHHGQIWNSFTPHPENPMILQYGHGPLFWVGVFGYGYLCILIASILLLRAALNLPHTYRQQSVALLLASVFPWGGNLFYLSGLHLLQGIDLTPISFSITGMISAYAIFRFRLLDLVPVARDVLIEIMQDGVIVLDSKNRLLDINPSALKMIGKDQKSIIGSPVTVVFDEQIKMIQHTDPSSVFHLQIPWGDHKESILDIHVVPITSMPHTYAGRLMTLRDVTQQKKIESELQEANERLRVQISEINELQHTLREQAIRDPLTGLYNRRFLNEILELELVRAERENQTVSLVMLDLDRFKDFNDTYGHSAGDEMLRELGELLRTQTRQGDFACRYGGEEFVIVMPGAPLDAALKRAEEWRLQFGRANIPHGNRKLRSTFSAGIATFPIHADTSETLLQSADEAMYNAKSCGRNRVMTHTLTHLQP